MTAARSMTALHRAWLALLLLALAGRAMVPAGWMPSTSSFGLMLCNGSQPMPSYADIARHRTDGVPFSIAVARAAIDHAEGKGPATPTPQDPHPCPFAGMALATPPPAVAAILQPQPARTPPPIATSLVAVGRGLAAPPPPATGPPSLA